MQGGNLEEAPLLKECQVMRGLIKKPRRSGCRRRTSERRPRRPRETTRWVRKMEQGFQRPGQYFPIDMKARKIWSTCLVNRQIGPEGALCRPPRILPCLRERGCWEVGVEDAKE